MGWGGVLPMRKTPPTAKLQKSETCQVLWEIIWKVLEKMIDCAVILISQ